MDKLIEFSVEKLYQFSQLIALRHRRLLFSSFLLRFIKYLRLQLSSYRNSADHFPNSRIVEILLFRYLVVLVSILRSWHLDLLARFEVKTRGFSPGWVPGGIEVGGGRNSAVTVSIRYDKSIPLHFNINILGQSSLLNSDKSKDQSVLVFNEILEILLATFLLDHRKCLRQFAHIHCWSSSVYRVRCDIGVRVHNRVVHDDCVVSHHYSLPQNTVPSYFHVVTDRHGLDYCPFFNVNIVSFLAKEVPMLMGTYLSSLFWRLVGGFIITISESITNFPILTFARSPRRMSLWCKMAWSQI